MATRKTHQQLLTAESDANLKELGEIVERLRKLPIYDSEAFSRLSKKLAMEVSQEAKQIRLDANRLKKQMTAQTRRLRAQLARKGA
jgi:formiminotetrahydrofolate cyclodeaminase